MIRDAGAQPDVLREMLRKANSKLTAARVALEHELLDEVSSRAYYAVYHAVCAVLACHGMSFSSHSQTIGAFNRDFVRTGHFPADMGRRLNRLFENRQVADYGYTLRIDRDVALTDLADACAMVQECIRHVAGITGQAMQP